MKGVVVIIALGILSLATPAGGETLTWEDCLRLARTASPELAAAQGRQEAESGGHRESRGQRLPQLSLIGNYKYTSKIAVIDLASRLPGTLASALGGMAPLTFGDHDSVEFGAQLTQPLFTGFALSANQRAAALKEEAAGWRVQETTLAVEERAALLYYNLGRADLVQQAAQTSLRQRQAHERDVANLLEVGQITRDELLKARVARLEAEERVQNAQAAQRLARLDLALAIGLEPSRAAALEVPSVTGLPPQPQIYTEQRPDRPESRARRAEIDAAAQSERAAGASYYPNLAAFASYNYGQPGVDPFKNNWMNYATAGVTMKWELWDWGTGAGRMARQRGTRQAGEAELARFERDLTEQVQASQVEVENAFTRAALRRQSLEAAREQLRIVADLFAQGQKNNTDYLDAEESAHRAELELIDSETAYRMAQVRLRRALGLAQSTVKGEAS